MGFDARRKGGARSLVTGLMAVVVAWWLLIGGALLLALPSPTASATPTVWALASGQRVRIDQSGITHWPIPVERQAFDTYYRGVQESDDGAIDAAFASSEWISTNYGEAARIVAIDGEAVQIELLEGSYAGRRAWVKPRH